MGGRYASDASLPNPKNASDKGLRWVYAQSLFRDTGATLDDLREAVTTLEDVGRIARRVLGSAHPTTTEIEDDLRLSRAALRARETPSGSS